MTQAKAKTNSVLTTTWDSSVLTIEVLGAGSIMFDMTKASPGNRAQAERHGWTQRLADRAAIARNQKTGQPATPQVKYAAIAELAAYYESGAEDWRMGGSGERDGGLLFTALCEFRPELTEGTIQEHLKSRTKEQLTALRAVPAIMEIMNRLRVERMGKVDTEAALGELDALSENVDDEIAELMK